MTICKNCNSLVSDTVTFCQNCGASLNNQTNNIETTNIVPNNNTPPNNETVLHQNTLSTVNRYFSEVLNQPLPENVDTTVRLEDILIKTNSADKYIHNIPYLIAIFFGCSFVLFLGSAILDSVFSLQIFNSSSTGSGGLTTFTIMLIITIIVSVLLFLYLLNKRANLRFSFKNNIQTYQYLHKIIVDNNLLVFTASIHSVLLSESKNVGKNQDLVYLRGNTAAAHQVQFTFSSQKIVVSAEGITFKKLFPGLMELEKDFI